MSDDLKSAMKQQADEQMTPAFDESLHVWTMERLNRERRLRAAAIDAARPDPFAVTLRKIAAWGTVAAAIVLVITSIVGNPFRTRPSPQDLAEWNQAFVSLRETAQPIEERFRLPVSQAEQQITLLEDDARNFGSFIADQLLLLAPADDESL